MDNAAIEQQRPIDRDALCVDHLYLVQHVVNSLAARYPRHVDRGELWSAGAFGLVDAAQRYDPATGLPFARFATIRIRGAIIDSTRSRDWATRSLRRRMREVGGAIESFEQANGRSASEVELAQRMGIKVDELAAHRAAAATATLLHLDQCFGDGDGADNDLAARVEERRQDQLPEAAMEQRELMGTIRVAVKFLPDFQRDVIQRYYFDGELLRDIAASHGVTEARASQVRSEALSAMRAYFGTAFEGVPAVDPGAPGLRRRAAYVSELTARSTWRNRLEAAADANELDARRADGRSDVMVSA